VLPDGSLLVIDQGKNALIKFDSKGTVVGTFTGQNTPAGELKNPTGVAADAQGNIYIADTWNHRVVKLNPALQFVTTWGTYASTNGIVSASPGTFYGPRAVAVDSQGNVYVTDTGNKRIEEFNSDGKFLAAFGGVGTAPGQLNEPVGIAFTQDGNLVVADLWNRRIQVLGPDGTAKRQWTVATWQTNVHNEPYVAVAPNGTVYVSDPMAQPGRILVYGADGSPEAVWEVSGAGLSYPTGLAVGPNNTLYVTDSQNHRVVVLAGRP
jgi:sugar lactone lactonase YvrE